MPLTDKQAQTAARRGVLSLRATRHRVSPLADVFARNERVSGQTDIRQPSAWWTFDTAKDRHSITIGDTRPLLAGHLADNEASANRIGRLLARHEAAHAVYTAKDLTALGAAGAAAGVPHWLVNLGEDARIEAAMRKKLGAFRWIRAGMAGRADTGEAADWLLQCVNYESESIGWTGPELTATGKPAKQFLRDTLRALVAAADTFAVIPIMAEFLREFPGQTNPMPYRLSDGLPGEKFRLAPDAPKRTPAGTPAGRNPLDDSKRVDADLFCGQQPATLDGGRVRAMAGRLRSIVGRAGSAPETIGQAGSRIYLPGAAAGMPEAFRRDDTAAGAPAMAIVCDMSGSMRKAWESAALLVAAFRDLAARGDIRARFFLSASPDGAQYAELAPADARWASVRPSSAGEGLRGTLATLAPVLRECRLAVVVTDGKLADGNIETARWRTRGVNLVGVALRPSPDDETTDAAMAEHFGVFYVANTPEEIAGRLASRLASRR